MSRLQACVRSSLANVRTLGALCTWSAAPTTIFTLCPRLVPLAVTAKSRLTRIISLDNSSTGSSGVHGPACIYRW